MMIRELIYEEIGGPALLQISLSFHFIMQNNSSDVGAIYQTVHSPTFSLATTHCVQANIAHQVIQ